MTDSSQDVLAAWSAFQGMSNKLLPAGLACERGVFGKEPVATSDFHWIAASPKFSGQSARLERELVLGSEDGPARDILVWRSRGDLHQAVRCYPARAPDASGRSGLEKQVLEWRRPADLPAALGAAVLLPVVAGLDESAWSGQTPDPMAEGFFVPLASLTVDDLPIRLAQIVSTLEDGRRELRETLGIDVLGELYARLLAGQRAIRLDQLDAPLSAAALVALLAPLERKVADELCVISWLPSSVFDEKRLRNQGWDLVLGSDAAASRSSSRRLDSRLLDAGMRLADALLAEAIERPTRDETTAPAQDSGDLEHTPALLSLWGPSQSGKTVFLAQLYWHLSNTDHPDWRIRARDGDSVEFFHRLRRRIYENNVFPKATAIGTVEKIVCDLEHKRTGQVARISLEDRAGGDFTDKDLIDEVKQRLLDAKGLVLLLDPTRDHQAIIGELAYAFDKLGVDADRDGRDTRPVAVCVTKADRLISGPEDYRAAIDDPAGFLKGEEELTQVLNNLRNKFTNTELFPVSAAGIRLGFGATEPVVFYDEELLPRINSEGEPFNLVAPIDWLVRKLSE